MMDSGKNSIKESQSHEKTEQSDQLTNNVVIQEKLNINFVSVKCGNRFTILQDGKTVKKV